MSVILFIIILAVLVLVHELGHFLVAKKSGIKVREFGIGFPPRIWGKQKGETLYSINAIPFGGFVKILGENPDAESISGPEKERSLIHKSKIIQVWVLSAGVIFNVIFAWLLISAGFIFGLPTPVTEAQDQVANPKVVVTTVAVGSPAEIAGIKAGDSISKISSDNNTLTDVTAQSVSNFIEANGDKKITVEHIRGKEVLTSSVVPQDGVVTGRKAIGVSLDMIGILKLPIHKALVEGAQTTANLTVAITVGLFDFLKQAVTGQADFSQVAGPVGIVGLVGDVSQLGFIFILSFTAFISINLAVINLIPIPALDGGRILFVIIEAIKGSPIKPKIANTLNTVGFALLILLMVIVTFNDIIKLF